MYSHKSKDGGDCSSKCESHVDATKDPRPLFPANRVELTDEDGEGDPVDLLRLVHQVAELHWASTDEPGPQGDGGDAQREQGKSKGGGALLQGEAAELLGVVEATTKLVFFLRHLETQPYSSTTCGRLQHWVADTVFVQIHSDFFCIWI